MRYLYVKNTEKWNISESRVQHFCKDDKYEEWESLIEGTDWLEFQ